MGTDRVPFTESEARTIKIILDGSSNGLQRNVERW
jgi:hypothetical protein